MTCRSSLKRLCQLWLAALVLAAGAASASPDPELLLLKVTVNGTPQGTRFVLRDAGGVYYADSDALTDWGMRKPFPRHVEMHGRKFHPFSDIESLDVVHDASEMTLVVDLPPERMNGQSQAAYLDGTPPPTAGIGGFMNYDLAYTDDPGAQVDLFSAQLEPTLFSPLGSLRSGLLYRDYSAPDDAFDDLDDDQDPYDEGFIRLDTTFVRDDPERLRSYRAGDSITPSSSFGRSLRFAGLQIATNFATRPGYVTFPLPSVSGTAAVPSTLDIYVNDSLRSTQNVDAGTFRIDEIPVVTGSGQVRVVTRDLLGREQVIDENFYASNLLLRAGLNDYAVSVGALRENFGNESNDYTDPLVSLFYRTGLTDRLTPEVRLDATDQALALGSGATARAGRFGIVQGAFSYGRDDDDDGVLWQLGQQYQDRWTRSTWRVQGTTEGYSQPGIDTTTAFPKLQSLISTGLTFRSGGSLGLTLIHESFHDDEDDREIATLSYSRTLQRILAVRATASYVQQDDNDLQLSVLFSRSFGRKHNGSMFLSHRDNESYARADYRRSLPSGPGYGYRLGTLVGDREGVELEGQLNTNYNRLSAEVRHDDGETGWRGSASGSVTWLDGHGAATRDVRNAFAVVDVGDYEDVRVYLENREIGRTNKDGQVLVPGLRPYETNRIRVEPEDLPLMTRLDDLSVEVAPYFRTGVAVEFDAQASRSALLRVITEDGEPVPEGARARLEGAPDWYPVGRDGMVYIEGLDRYRKLEIAWNGTLCRVPETLPATPSGGGLVKLGDFRCEIIRQ